jgi:hypothetical protein
VIALPCVVDGSRISSFSYATSCTCVYQLVWRTFCFKVIGNLMQDVRSQVTNKQTGPDSSIFRTRRLQQSDHSFRYSFCLPSVAVMALRWSVLQEDDILCKLCADTRSDVSDNSDDESLDSDSDVPTTSSRKQLGSSIGPLTPQFPHPFFLTYIKTIFITV